MNNIIQFSGIKTPRYKAQRIRQDMDQDLFVDLLANHPEHISRAKAKREEYLARKAMEAAMKSARKKEQEWLLRIFGNVAVWSLLALMVVICL